VAGLPLLYVETPTFSGPKLVVKSTLDWIAALMLVIVLLPVMLVVAVVIKSQDGGSVFFRQQRVGLDGETSRLSELRSVRIDAEAQLEALKQQQAKEQDVDRGVLFKMESDPRITPFGHFIRRYSIDELPQLFDVLCGKMSLVGPRPPLPDEVSQYEHDVH